MPTCKQCAAAFEITKDDLQFYESVSPTFSGKRYDIPAPQMCPDCRCQRRLLFRNDLTLYHRKSDLSGKQIVSMYAPDKPYVVYDQDEWWSDKWDECSYGRPFDFSKTFTEQFEVLNKEVPHMSLFTTNAENSYYTNHSLNARNTYLIAGATDIEDSLYGRFVISCQNIVDGLSLYSCRWCYGCVASQECYQCHFTLYSHNCSDCLMIEDCQGCKNCCLCFGLKNQEYCFLNERIGKAEYEKRMKELLPLTAEKIDLLKKRLASLKLGLPHRAAYVFASEDSSGDMVFNSKHCRSCYDVSGCEDCMYVTNTPKGFSSRDANYTAPHGVRFCYNVCSTVGSERSMGTFLLWYGNDAYYIRECHHCSNVFGCSSMKRKQYCILNKQYTKEEYEELVPKIIEHMRKTGEWGEYPHPQLSTMGYNETLAQEYYPITRDIALNNGWKWYETQEKKDAYMGPAFAVPATIDGVSDDICEQILTCSVTGKPFKIIPQELKFYRLMGLPIPRQCPDQRHTERLALRNLRKLWSRKCSKCGNGIETTYSPKRPEIVYCEECYLSTIY
ncbi:MAG: Uncharacterized protein Greene101449_28 [Candidatus Peregrinibacteria bacterium Greene1014_49]|nr:MAG: Uncharacterized protein Greene101449_28 [Candidatus Peregrinibacteria bacterium Greene1014_49]